MKAIPDLLGEHPFFIALDPEWLELIAGCSINVHYEPRQPIMSEGDPADKFYVLRRGKVAIEIAGPATGPIIVETLGPGEILGASWLFPPYRNGFDAEALEATSAVEVDAACLRGKCDEDPAVGYELFKRFAGLMRDRLQAARFQLLDLYGSHVG